MGKNLKNPFLVLTIIFIVLAIGFGLHQKKDDKEYDKKVKAVVISVRKKYDSDDDKYKYKAHCEYIVNERKYTYDTTWSTHKYVEKEEVEISINSDHPERVNKHIFGTIAIMSLIMAVMMFFLFIKNPINI